MTSYPNHNSEVWSRIEMVIRWSGLSINAFARHIGLRRGENLYQIKRGNNGLSIKVANMMCEKFPEVDELWLLTGKKEMLHTADMCHCFEDWKEEAPNNKHGEIRSCSLCIAGRILSMMIEKEVDDPVGAAFRCTEELISKYNIEKR